MKGFLQILLFINVIWFGYGLYLQYMVQSKLYSKVMGSGVLFLVVILLPIFLYHRYKDKSLEDYRFKGFKKDEDRS